MSLGAFRLEPYRIELSSLFKLAIPILIGQLAQTGNGVADTIMSGHYSTTDQAAVAIGTSIWFPLMLLTIGIIIGATPLLAQAISSKQHNRVTPLTWQAIWIGFFLGCFAGLVLYNNHLILALFVDNPNLYHISNNYLQAVAWGMPAIGIYSGLRAYTEALSHAFPIMLINIISLLINIALNDILINGRLGLSELGGIGCGWATAISMWLMLIMMFIYVRYAAFYQRLPQYHKLHFSLQKIDSRIIKEILRLGLPTGIAIFVEVSAFCVIALLLVPLGESVVASHQIALNFSSLIYMIPLSFTFALTVRCAYAYGLQDKSYMKISAYTGIIFITLIACINAILILTFREQVTELYSIDPEVQTLAASLLFLAAFFQISDGIYSTTSGALRGFNDTLFPMIVIVIAAWGIKIPLGYLLCYTDIFGKAYGAEGFWIALCVGLTFTAIVLFPRLLRKHLR